jgi:fluoroquinolone resistance protein
MVIKDLLPGKEYADQTFQGLVMGGESLRDCLFSDCKFVKSRLTDIDFESCSFHNCQFQNCDLSLIRVNNSSFVSTSFKECKMIGINWTDAYWPKGRLLATLHFEGCSINHSVLAGLILPRIHIQRCVALEVDFTEADLSEADCRSSDFAKSRFFNTNLSGANFSGATNYTIAPGTNKIKGAIFSLPEAMSLLYNLDIILTDEAEEN